MIQQYLWNILVSIDQLFNTLFGGSPDETLSSRVGRNYRGTFIEKSINFAFSWYEDDHCQNNIEPEDRAKKAVIK